MPSRVGRLELLDPAAAADDASRYLVTLDGVPLGLLPWEPAETEPASGPAEHAIDDLWREIAIGVAAGRLRADTTPEAPPENATVVVCTRDRAGRLAGCLEALAAQRHPSYEVIVVDNAPGDDTTREVALAWSTTYACEPRPGLDWARNRGLTVARTSIVAFTDDDARPEPGWLEGICRGFVSPEVAAVTGLVVPAELSTAAQRRFEDGSGGMGKGYRLRFHSHRWRSPAYRPEWVGVGCNMAFRRGALLDLGGFDTALDAGTATGGGGDLDAFQRLLEAGWTIAYRPDAVVAHVHRRADRALERQLFDNGRAYSAMLTAAFLRARGRERNRVLARYLRWLAGWHARRLARALVGRERLPLRLVAAETAGAPLGPALYWHARREARRLGAAGAGAGESRP